MAQRAIWVQAPDGIAYQIRRVNSMGLAEHRHAELVGAAAADEELKRIQAEIKAEADAWKAAHVKAEDKAEAEAKRAAWAKRAEEAEQEAMIRTLIRHPKMMGAQMQRIDAYCLAAVIGAAQPSHKREPNYPPSVLEAIKAAEADPTKAEAIEAARESLTYTGRLHESEIEGAIPFGFVSDPKDEDPKAGRFWIGGTDETTKTWLASVISRYTGSPTVGTFRPAS